MFTILLEQALAHICFYPYNIVEPELIDFVASSRDLHITVESFCLRPALGHSASYVRGAMPCLGTNEAAQAASRHRNAPFPPS